MSVKLIPILAVAASLGLAACDKAKEKSALDMPPGKYERSSTYTDKYGTTYDKESSTEVYYEDGRKKAVIESENTKDPEGLFNKSTTYKSKKVVTQ